MIGAVVLAAGAATRFGTPKQRLMVEDVLERVRAARIEELFVVSGAYDLEASAPVVDVVHNGDTWFQVDDPPPVPSFAATTQSGLFFQDGSPKLAFSAYRFPFVGDRIGRRTVRVWGLAPSSGGVSVQRQSGGGWRTLKRLHARGDRVFAGKISLRGGATLRAAAGGETSLSWQQR